MHVYLSPTSIVCEVQLTPILINMAHHCDIYVFLAFNVQPTALLVSNTQFSSMKELKFI